MITQLPKFVDAMEERAIQASVPQNPILNKQQQEMLERIKKEAAYMLGIADEWSIYFTMKQRDLCIEELQNKLNGLMKGMTEEFTPYEKACLLRRHNIAVTPVEQTAQIYEVIVVQEINNLTDNSEPQENYMVQVLTSLKQSRDKRDQKLGDKLEIIEQVTQYKLSNYEDNQKWRKLLQEEIDSLGAFLTQNQNPILRKYADSALQLYKYPYANAEHKNRLQQCYTSGFEDHYMKHIKESCTILQEYIKDIYDTNNKICRAILKSDTFCLLNADSLAKINNFSDNFNTFKEQMQAAADESYREELLASNRKEGKKSVKNQRKRQSYTKQKPQKVVHDMGERIDEQEESTDILGKINDYLRPFGEAVSELCPDQKYAIIKDKYGTRHTVLNASGNDINQDMLFSSVVSVVYASRVDEMHKNGTYAAKKRGVTQERLTEYVTKHRFPRALLACFKSWATREEFIDADNRKVPAICHWGTMGQKEGRYVSGIGQDQKVYHQYFEEEQDGFIALLSKRNQLPVETIKALSDGYYKIAFPPLGKEG